MKTLVTALALFATSSAAHAQDHSAEAVASAILNGFLARDVAAIAPHSNDNNAEFFAELTSGAASVDDLFGGWRGAAGTSWNGMILPARYLDGDTAVIPFAIETETGSAPLGTGTPERVIAVVLTLDSPQDTSWGLEDFNAIGFESYMEMASTPG